MGWTRWEAEMIGMALDAALAGDQIRLTYKNAKGERDRKTGVVVEITNDWKSDSFVRRTKKYFYFYFVENKSDFVKCLRSDRIEDMEIRHVPWYELTGLDLLKKLFGNNNQYEVELDF